MPGAGRRVVSAIMFYPRGGSSHGARAFARRLPREGWRTTLVSGSRSDAGALRDARHFYDDVSDLRVADFTASLRAVDPLDPPAGAVPLQPSYEDRPGAPDVVFARLDDAALVRQTREWARVLDKAGAGDAAVLHLHHLTPLNAAAALVAPGVPIVAHLHGTELLMAERIAAGAPASWTHATAWGERLRGWAQAAQLVVIATPRGARRAARVLELPHERIALVPNGVDARRFSPGGIDRDALWRRVLLDEPRGWLPGGEPGTWRAPPQDVAALSHDVVLLAAGRFTAVKRLPQLIAAFGEVRRRLGGCGVSLVLVGGHPGEWEGEHPAQTIERLGARGVLLAGWYDHDELPALLRASDAVVLASERESFGLVLVEGMACERPAIAMRAGGPAEIVRDGETGWLVEPGDDEHLVAALIAATNDRSERERRGRLAREDVLARFTWSAVTHRLALVLDEAATRS